MKYLFLTACLLCAGNVEAKKLETLGLHEVKPWEQSKMEICIYIGKIEFRSKLRGWSSFTTTKNTTNRIRNGLYKKAKEQNATHLIFEDDPSHGWGTLGAGSAHAFNCKGVL